MFSSSSFSEDTYTKQEQVDGQDVTVKIMDTYDKVYIITPSTQLLIYECRMEASVYTLKH